MKTIQGMVVVKHWVLVMFFGLAAAANIMAEPSSDEMAGGDCGQHRMGKMAESLGLSDEQREQVKSIHEASKDEMKALKESSKQGRMALKEAVDSGASDSEIDELSAQQGKLMGEMIALKTKNKSRVAAVLTDEQRAKAKEMRGKMGEYMKDRKHRKGKSGCKDGTCKDGTCKGKKEKAGAGDES